MEYLKGVSLVYVPLLLKNIRLGWIDLSGTTTIANYKHSQITAVKSFITLGRGSNIIKLFTSVIYIFL